MPAFARYFIKTSLVFFLVSLFLGICMASGSIFTLPDYLTSILPTYIHMFMVGWITQMIFGVSIWMFPSPDNDNKGRYGNERVIWAIYWTLNAGLLLRVFGEPGKVVFQQSILINFSLALSAFLQWLAALLYTYHIWGRVKGK